ncbi:Muniscin C-terminal mu homology domain-containing protein [Senna tora]|uniref:Muniscin C-terminal mu homology domain-containing protein n=1 Tax=Senna tora TaxID=362788 RepID=A0A834X4D6_9FABA|nr:Muniscin C-terminal mu homology domain-containing protein [Senna tora]
MKLENSYVPLLIRCWTNEEKIKYNFSRQCQKLLWRLNSDASTLKASLKSFPNPSISLKHLNPAPVVAAAYTLVFVLCICSLHILFPFWYLQVDANFHCVYRCIERPEQMEDVGALDDPNDPTLPRRPSVEKQKLASRRRGERKTGGTDLTEVTKAFRELEVSSSCASQDEEVAATHINVEGVGFATELALGGTFKAFCDAQHENLLVKKTETKGHEIYLSEEVNAEFSTESFLARVGFMGFVYFRTLSPTTSEFSFRVERISAVKRFAIDDRCVSSVDNRIFYVRAALANESIPIIEYSSSQPGLIPLPLKVHIFKARTGRPLSVQIKYESDPDFPAPLSDVTFTLKLSIPIDQTFLLTTPKHVSISKQEIKWHVREILPKGPADWLTARFPAGYGEVEAVLSAKFTVLGKQSSAGMSLHDC